VPEPDVAVVLLGELSKHRKWPRVNFCA
jgi:hypothetical protein